MAKFFVPLLLGVFLFPAALFAGGNVVINEIAWMGTKESANNEWIELADTSSQEVDMSGWHLDSVDGGVKITLTGKIPANGFFLLERTNDATVAGIKADQIYTGALSNAGEVLILRDAHGQEINRVDAASGWPAGNSATKETMQWVSGKWISATATPKATNALAPSQAPPSDSQVNPGSQTATQNLAAPAQSEQTPPIIQNVPVKEEPIKEVRANYPQSIYISEFMPDPKGPDEAAEWIELYNDADTPANIAGFFLDDAEGGSLAYAIAQGTIIGAKGYLVFKRSDTNIALNNKSDTVRLLYPDKRVAASVSYVDAKEGQSAAYDFGKRQVFWTEKPTPGAANIFTPQTKIFNGKGAPVAYQQSSTQKTQEASLRNVDTQGIAPSENTLPLGASSQGSFSDFWFVLGALAVGVASAIGYLKFFRKVKLVFLVGIILAVPFFARAERFTIASELDSQGRQSIEADAIKSAAHSIFFVEQGVSVAPTIIDNLSKEFEETMEPRLTELLGSAYTPGIDSDARVSILLMKMAPSIGGYVNGEDELPKSVKPNSNERALIYLNTDFLSRYRVKEFLAHEFTHIITFNQKVRRLKKQEEVWLNEARSEYAPTYLGYDNENFNLSNLKERYDDFLSQSYDHLITWNNTAADYAVVTMFAQYLGARFGSDFFKREIKTDTVGIASVESALQTFDPRLTFAKFFSEWRLTNYINDDAVVGGKYSYKNKNLSFRFAPELTLDLHAPSDSAQLLTASVPTFSAKAVSFNVEGNRLTLDMSVADPSRDMVVTYFEQRKDNMFRDGQFSLENGKAAIRTDKNTVGIIALLSNASSKIINTTFTIAAKARGMEPTITSIEPVFLHPTLENNAILITGEDFDPKAALYVNGKPQTFIYQDDAKLIANISTLDKTIEVKLVNPDGATGVFTWQNPLVGNVLAVKSAPNFSTLRPGSLVRAAHDYNESSGLKIYLYYNGYLRHIVNQRILSFYAHLKTAPVDVINSPELAALPVSTLIRASGDTKVYEVLANDKKRWIRTAQDFVARGFDWKAIFEVNKKELNFYETTL